MGLGTQAPEARAPRQSRAKSDRAAPEARAARRSRAKSIRRGRGALVLLLVGCLAQALGCATSGQRAEREQNARKVRSHLDVGADHLANGRAALALREFLAAEKLGPDNAEVHYALGEAYFAQRKFEEAEAHLKRALELHEDYHDARLSYTALLLFLERYEEVIAQCDQLLDDPTFSAPWRALTNRGSAELRLGRVAKARETFQLAREYREDFWPATLALAILEGEAGHRLEAIRLFEDVIARDPGPRVESEINYRLGELYVALGQRRQAVGHLTASVSRSPDSRWAKKSQEYLKLLH